MEKFVLFDGNAILHRAYHALPPLTTKSGDPINAVYGMMSMTLKILEELKPRYLAYAFDTKEPTFRNKLSAEYQAQRPDVDPSLIGQFAKARETLAAFHIPFYEKPGYEADDIIGTIVDILEKKSEIDEVIVVTGDRDMLQLVSDKTSLLMPSGISIGKLMKAEETKEKMGVYPNKIVEYKALVGDPSDNYRGVAGVGPKTAIKLIEQYDTLENMIDQIETLPKAVAEKLRTSKDSAILSKKLATIVRDVPLPEFDMKASASWRLDSPDGLSLFGEYGFNTLTKRVIQGAKLFPDKNQQALF